MRIIISQCTIYLCSKQELKIQKKTNNQQASINSNNNNNSTDHSLSTIIEIMRKIIIINNEEYFMMIHSINLKAILIFFYRISTASSEKLHT